MTNFLKSIARRKNKEDPGILVALVAESFAEADPHSPARTLPKAKKLYELARFSGWESIVPLLRSKRGMLKRALAFAKQIGDTRLADILASALDGVSHGPAVMSGMQLGTILSQHAEDMGIVLDTEFGGQDWGGTDLALSLSMNTFEAALLEEIIKAADDFELQPPLRLQQAAKEKRRLARSTKAYSAVDLFQQLVATKKTQLEVGCWEDAEAKAFGNGMEIKVSHVLNPPASAKDLAKAHATFGIAAKNLLDIYALHNGGDLFKYRKTTGFVLVSMEHWAELHAHAVEWAEMAWDKEDIPAYFYSAIAFGKIPGDKDCWLLITEGKFAGTIMYSDTDSIDEPSFKNIHDFFSNLLHNTGNILNIGAYVQYQVQGAYLHPMRCVFES